MKLPRAPCRAANASRSGPDKKPRTGDQYSRHVTESTCTRPFAYTASERKMLPFRNSPAILRQLASRTRAKFGRAGPIWVSQGAANPRLSPEVAPTPRQQLLSIACAGSTIKE